ncbi:MAG: hypothetical protein CVT49_08205 [candidate division Zixibacteria bacterium HGW-Zixibacteria-1]|nr:MAG: hypothetical protein CVT49_08205 [candidate division Zixibacteria bacterium HGW-Zixibacteria-1]
MNNPYADEILMKCRADLDQALISITGVGKSSLIAPFITKFAIIRACGAIEIAFKSIVADFCSKDSNSQVRNFISKKIKEKSYNPSYAMICNVINDFDNDWKDKFKAKIESLPDKAELLMSLQSLVNARNEFAHGGNPGSSIEDISKYFSDSRRIIEELDTIIS